MRGVARSSAAITVVNALPTGVGCAIGFERFVTTTVEFDEAPRNSFACDPPDSATPLVRACVASAATRFGQGRSHRVSVQLRSNVPVAKGLKSSSAVATSVLLATARALDATPSPVEVARLAAATGRSVGVSATGAMDDALASLRPGFVLTDNRTDSVIAETPAPPEWAVVVYIPAGVHAPAPSWKARFELAATEAGGIVEAARACHFPEAMRRNSELVESVMGYDYSGLRHRMLDAGAVAASVSGLGPAVAALVPRDRQRDVLGAVPAQGGERFLANLTREGAP